MRDAMITSFEALPPSATIADAADALLRTTQVEFPVLGEDGRLRGFVTRSSMIDVLGKSGKNTSALEAMQRDIPVVKSSDRLEKALQEMQRTNAPAVGVIGSDGRLEGYITAENIGELMMLEATVGRL